MSTPFYDLASLVVVPSGYKTSKVYAQKPLTTDGQLAFSRSTDATRVASSGLIEKVRTNLFPTGSALLATGWTSVGATLTAGQTDPNGGTTALRVQLAAGGSPYSYILQSFTGSAATYARSAYIKAASAQSIRIVDPHSGAGTTVNLTTNWQRFTAVGAGVAPNFGIQFDNNNDAAAKDFTIAFVQVETGDIATNYIATISAAVSVGPVANVPRLDYLNSSCPRLLLEPQRTNLATYSEQANQYSLVRATIGSNVLASPDGTSNADSLIEDGDNGAHAFYNFGLTTFTAADYTASIFAKKGSRDWFALQLYHSSSHIAYFNLNTGVVGTVGAGATATITNYGNGWYRCTITATTTANAGGIAIYGANADNSISYAGTNGLTAGYFYGWQLELGAYATSYIPTLGAAVTRGADACSKTGISSLIGQTEGTLFAEFNVPSIASAGTYTSLNISDGTSNNIIDFAYYPTGRIQAAVLVGGSVTVNIDLPSYGLTAGTHKVAFAYKLNDYVLYVDGVQRGSDTSSAVPATSKIDLLAGLNATQVYNQALLFKTRLTNAQLAELTTL